MTQDPTPSWWPQVRGRELVLDRCSRPEREQKKGVASQHLLGELIQRLEMPGLARNFNGFQGRCMHSIIVHMLHCGEIFWMALRFGSMNLSLSVGICKETSRARESKMAQK